MQQRTEPNHLERTLQALTGHPDIQTFEQTPSVLFQSFLFHWSQGGSSGGDLRHKSPSSTEQTTELAVAPVLIRDF